MKEITFNVEPCGKTGGFVARWDDVPGKGGITKRGDAFAELDAMVADAVNGFFEPSDRPSRVRLHFVEDPVVALAWSYRATSTGLRPLARSGVLVT